jgi:hypothetical protein
MKDRIDNNTLKDYSCILKGEQSNANIINLPLFPLYSYTFKYTEEFLKNELVTRIPPKDICVIVSNGDSEGREIFFDRLEQRCKIDYAGWYKNNVNRVEAQCMSPGFIDYVSQYKFIITMENSKNKDYITEKILEGFAAKTIPVYWGSDNICAYFNEERFINVKSFSESDMDNAIDRIISILGDTNKYLEIINKPIYVNNTIPFSIESVANDIKRLLIPSNTFIITVCYRARGYQSFRRDELIKLIRNCKDFFDKSNISYKIVISEQNDDELFNRGILLNISFLEAEKIFTFPKKYLHMNTDYNFNLNYPFPKEFIEFKSGFLDCRRILYWNLLGSACLYDSESYKKINGFPNDLYGWGGDDWAIFHRIMSNNIEYKVYEEFNSTNNGFIIEELAGVSREDGGCNAKNMGLAFRNDWDTNGLNSSKYTIEKTGEFHDGNTVYHFVVNINV